MGTGITRRPRRNSKSPGSRPTPKRRNSGISPLISTNAKNTTISHLNISGSQRVGAVKLGKAHEASRVVHSLGIGWGHQRQHFKQLAHFVLMHQF